MTKLSNISAIATVAALLVGIPVASFAGGDSNADHKAGGNHNYQEAKSQREVATLHDASGTDQTASTGPQQASAK